MTEHSDLAFDIHMHMIRMGYKWKQDGELVTPSPEDIQVGIDRLIERLSDEPVGTGIQGGRLYINKQEGVYDVFIHIGEVK